MKFPETGPIYGVPLLETLPLGTNGGMLQQMPTRQDLQDVRQFCERACAGYEVLLSHYRAKCERVSDLEAALKHAGSELQKALKQLGLEKTDASENA